MKTIVASCSKNSKVEDDDYEGDSLSLVDEADSDEEDEEQEEECWNFASTQDDNSGFVGRPSKWRMGS